MTVYLSDYDKIKQKGFFFGYNSIVWLNIIIQSSGGLIVAVVIKYADNILKGFATSIAIIVSCLASVYLFDTVIDFVFAFGTLLVVVSVVLYSYTPPSPQLPVSSTSSLSSSPRSLKSDESDLIYLKSQDSSDSNELIKYKLNSLINNSPNLKNDLTIEMRSNN